MSNGRLNLVTSPVLIVGPKPSKSGKIGGVVESFDYLVKEVDSCNVAYRVIDSNVENYKTKVFAVLWIWIRIITQAPRSRHVTLHLQVKDFIYIAPLAVLIAKFFGRTVSLRKFAGDFDIIFERLSFIQRKAIVFSLVYADCCFFEAQYLVDKFRRYNSATYWFPTSRPAPRVTRDKSRPYQRRFVFASRVCKEKGVKEILLASSALDNGYSIAIYGPIEDEGLASLDWLAYPHVSYKGQVSASEVPYLLSEYDVLLLPSRLEGEGYPGIIVEALQAGVPVVASRLRGIAEMITSGIDGILINPGKPDELIAAMRSIDEESFARMSVQAQKRARLFDNAVLTADFLQKIGIDPAPIRAG